MTIRLDLPAEMEKRLLAEVQTGRHASVEEAILEKLSHSDDLDLLAGMGKTEAQLRRDLDDAWNNRQGAVDGESVFARIAAKSAISKARDK